jgi:hypothetical protein
MPVKRSTDGWGILKEEIDRFHGERDALEAIANIVAKHPEWVEQEHELEKYLKVLFGDNALTQ